MGQTATQPGPPGLRRAVKRQFATLVSARHGARHGARHAARRVDRLRAALLARRQALAEGPGRAVVTVDGQQRIAHLQRAPSPVQARRAGVLAVTRALKAGGVDHFCVRGWPRGPAVVAVPGAQRRRACRVLARLCRARPAYVTPYGVPDGVRQPRLVPGHEHGVWPRLERADVLRLTWFRTEPGRRLVVGEQSGCEVEFWRLEDDRLVAPRRDRVTGSVPAAAPAVKLVETGSWGCGRVTMRTRAEFTHPLPDDVTSPVDAVCTWPDGSGHEELRYSLRSLATYAPWIRHVFLVTDGQAPQWLDTAHPGLTVVGRNIVTGPGALPTVDPYAVEPRLHRIEGLAEHFLHFAGGVFLGGEIVPEDFFLADGQAKFLRSPPHALRRGASAETEEALPGRVAEGRIGYAYLDLAHESAPGRLDRLLAARDRTVFCIDHHTRSGEPGGDARTALLGPFLEAYFPVPSAYELPG